MGDAMLIGLCVTIATSWLAMPLPTGNAWNGPPTNEFLGLWRGSDERIWNITRGSNRWHSVVSYGHLQISGQSFRIPEADYAAREFDPEQLPRRFRPESVDGLRMWAAYHSTGWPLPALSCAVLWERQVRNSDILYRAEGGVQLPRDAQFNPRALPLTPVWPGFFINTLLFASGYLAVAWLARSTRQKLRRLRGMCPRCRYSRAGLEDETPCPECGGPA